MAPEGIASAMEVTSGAGPVMVTMYVSTLAGGRIVVVTPGFVMYWVTVATLGVGRMMSWTEPLIVTEYVVRDWARIRDGIEAAKPKREIVKNMFSE